MKKKKKTIIAVLTILIIILGSVFLMFGEKIGPNKGMPKGLSLEEKKDWVAEKLYESMYTREIIDIGYKELSQKDIEAKKQNIDLTKEYPLEINALFEIGTNTATLLYFSDELKDLGVNTYFVHAEIQIKDGKLKIFQPAYSQKGLLSQEEAKRVIIDRILMAKQNGFSVGFVTDLPDVSFGIGRENYDIKTLNPQYEKLVLEWAKIAEEYGVEYFVPINEYEVLLSVNGYSLEEVYQYTNDFYEDIIPKIREVYNGKIIIKSGGMDSWSDHLGFSKKGADLFGFGPWYACNTDEIKRRTKELVEVADEISIRDGVPWLVTEYYIATQEDIDEDVDESFSERGVAIPMGDAYRAGLSEIKKSKENVGFTFTGYIGRGKIRGTEAVLILKDYFNE